MRHELDLVFTEDKIKQIDKMLRGRRKAVFSVRVPGEDITILLNVHSKQGKSSYCMQAELYHDGQRKYHTQSFGADFETMWELKFKGEQYLLYTSIE